MQQLQLLLPEFHHQVGYAREVAARPIEACDESHRDRIGCHREHDRNGGGGRLSRACRHSSSRGDHRHLIVNQLGRKRRQSIDLTSRPTVFDRYVAAFHETAFAQTLAECDR